MFKVGVIGLGRMGVGFEDDPLRPKPASHLGAFQLRNLSGRKFRDTCVTAICDINKKKLSSVAQKWKIPSTYSDYKTMFVKEDLDILSVCVPTPLHFDVVMNAALESAARLIFCEKPIAETLSQARKMVKRCKKHEVSLAINHTRRWDTNFRSLAHDLEKGLYGKILKAVAFCSRDPFDVGIHAFDLMNWLAPKGIHEFIQLQTDYLVFNLELYGENCKIGVYDNGRIFKIWGKEKSAHYSGYNELETFDKGTDSKLWFSFPIIKETFTPIYLAVENLSNHLLKGEPLYCTGEDGLKALESYFKWKNKKRRTWLDRLLLGD